ncbi:chymotrypsinogen A-like [Heptranchias perlo]|uniref:chymotrypsinogen A-like n=1 Tax=Heptranchias perlo TaxID=212740 RepID=UPI003559E99D
MTFVRLHALMILTLLLALPLLAENPIKCGTRKVTSKGTGKAFRGKELQTSNWPWQVSLELVAENKHFCGGAIINEYWIITAAHCFITPTTQNLQEIVVVVGLNRQLSPEMWARYSNPHDIIVHEEFDEQTGANDIALVRMIERIAFGEHVRPVCFPDSAIFFENTWTTCYVTGWMKTGEDTSDSLQEAPITLISPTDCNSTVLNGKLTTSMMCMDFQNNGSVACHIDGGGPVVCKIQRAHRYFLIGVVSWVSDCKERWPGVFSTTKSYLSWIEHVTARYGKTFDFKEYGSETVIQQKKVMSKLRSSSQHSKNHSVTSTIFPELLLPTDTRTPITTLAASGNLYTTSVTGIALFHLRSLLVTVLAT